MVDYSEITVKHEGSISTIILNRPDMMNVLTLPLVSQLKAALDECAARDECKAVVLTAEGKAFSVGGDIQTMKSEMNVEQKLEFIRYSADVVTIISSMDKLVIAAVNGLAVGAGFNYVLATDYVLAAEDAKFMQGFSKLGLIPDAGGTYFLPRAVGVRRAKELYLTNRLISAEDAKAMGIINEISQKEKLMENAVNFAKEIIDGPFEAYIACKHLFNQSSDINMNSALDAETYAQVLLMFTSDHQEGVNAFIEKRTPVFTGK